MDAQTTEVTQLTEMSESAESELLALENQIKNLADPIQRLFKGANCESTPQLENNGVTFVTIEDYIGNE